MLIITGYYETLDIFRKINYCENLLSINDPEVPSLQPQIGKFVENFVEVRFHDINKPEKDLLAPSIEQIEEIVGWANNCFSQNALIHCGVGTSRSTAAALITMCEWGDSVEKAVETLIILKPLACPNRLMLQLYGNQNLENLVEQKQLF